MDVPELAKWPCLNPKNGLFMWAKTGLSAGQSATDIRRFKSYHSYQQIIFFRL